MNNAATAVYNQNVARSIALSAQAQLELEGNYPERAPLLALSALENYPYTWQAERALGETVLGSRVRRVLPASGAGLGSPTWSPDGTTLATIGGGAIQFWDMTTGEPTRRVETGYSGGTISWSPDAETLLVVDADGAVHLWDVERGELRLDIPSPDGEPIMRAEWSADSAQFLTIASTA